MNARFADVQLILLKHVERRKKMRAEQLVNDDTGRPFEETTTDLCLKNADQYTYNQTELHKLNIVDGTFVPRASLFCMVGNAYVASFFADLPTDHSAFCHSLTLRKRRRFVFECTSAHIRLN